MISRPIAIGIAGAVVVIVAFVLNYNYDKDPTDQIRTAEIDLASNKKSLPLGSKLDDVKKSKIIGSDQSSNKTASIKEGFKNPAFDLVRVDPEGNIVIAGRGESGAIIEILDGETVIGTVEADDRGEWVFVPDVRLEPGSRILILRDISDRSLAKESDNAVVLVIPKPGMNIIGIDGKVNSKPLAMVVPRNKKNNVATRLIQVPGLDEATRRNDLNDRKPALKKADQTSKLKLTLRTIDYDEKGSIIFSGLSQPMSTLRIYVDNILAGVVRADNQGNWQLKVENMLAPGKYEIRLDRTNLIGEVVERVQLPFMKVPNIDASKEKSTVVIQPGNSLWRIAARVYGSGFRYTEIYKANSTQIRDPNLIYPGQIFKLPKEQEIK
jgi:hypothetical protein